MEWADDFQAHHLKGYGETINYRMGVPLLQDVITTMERAMSASEGLTLSYTKNVLHI
jgi:multiple inositol-polyphosphate phosphatase/2,3-bisphosphoglycerate 3-phosphatase